MMRKRLLIASTVAWFLLACRFTTGSPIVLGAAGPWTEEYGAMNRRGIELAIDELNARSGSTAPRVQVVFRDDGGDGMRATAIAQEFVNRRDIVAVIGHVNSGAMVAAARVYDGHLPAVATTASTPALTGISPWTFRVISSDSTNGLEIARFVMRRGRRRAAILYENNAYGRGLTDAFVRGFKGEIVSADPIAEGGAQDFEPFVTYFKRQSPDVVFVAGTGSSGLAFLREARRQALRADLVGGDGWSVLAADTILADGIYVGAPFSAEDNRAEAQRFVEKFRRRYGMTPDGNAALAYDATMLLANVAIRAGSHRERVRDYLAQLGESGGFHGVTGTIAFSAQGDPVGKAIVMTRVRNGALTIEENQ
ncbi:MAG TPA: ABC transporter substrate-binding protein [Gemmatimonadaceae bacterium]|nr:ABC transporter substrate-binding protein [Gemmatimonadaceae bacterium]